MVKCFCDKCEKEIGLGSELTMPFRLWKNADGEIEFDCIDFKTHLCKQCYIELYEFMNLQIGNIF